MLTLENWAYYMEDLDECGLSYPSEPSRKCFFTGNVNGEKVTLFVDSFGFGNFLSGDVEYRLGEPNPEYERFNPNTKDFLRRKYAENVMERSDKKQVDYND